jgi:hypothetical protein
MHRPSAHAGTIEPSQGGGSAQLTCGHSPMHARRRTSFSKRVETVEAGPHPPQQSAVSSQSSSLSHRVGSSAFRASSKDAHVQPCVSIRHAAMAASRPEAVGGGALYQRGTLDDR